MSLGSASEQSGFRCRRWQGSAVCRQAQVLLDLGLLWCSAVGCPGLVRTPLLGTCADPGLASVVLPFWAAWLLLACFWLWSVCVFWSALSRWLIPLGLLPLGLLSVGSCWLEVCFRTL